MTTGLVPAEAGKFAAAYRSAQLVRDGMRLGLGTGSTAVWMVRCVAARARDEGLDLTCVATSDRTGALAAGLGLIVVSFDDLPPRPGPLLDLTIDGADEFDPQFRLIKGGGGAHLREKIVAAASDEMVVITDPSKEVATLGAFALPVEITPFGAAATTRAVAGVLADHGLGAAPMALRGGATAPFVTDEGNLIVDLNLGAIPSPEALDAALLAVPGVVETGLFLDLCSAIIIGHADGSSVLRRADGSETRDTADPALAATLPATA